MDYRPKLAAISVAVDKLVLDPNNPRFLTHEEDLSSGNPSDPGIQAHAHQRMLADEYRIEELKDSIRKNGWQPVDMIFVRREEGSDRYLVLEGNRRVTAIREVKKELPADERQDLDPLNVMEVLDDGPLEEVQAKIAYLLGVRHHGSLRPWSPFAQAHNIYRRYLLEAGQDDDSFFWKPEAAEAVARTLSVKTEEVQNRLRVYRVMKQIDQVPSVASIGGIKGRYYSVCAELLLKRGKKSPLRKYIAQDPSSFQLTEEGLDRIDRLGHFSREERAEAPINNPAEWRQYEKILADEDEDRRAQMITAVEVEKQKPSEVYAERAAELRKPRWDTWLREVAALLGRPNLAELDPEDPLARDAITHLLGVLASLETGAPSGEGADG